MTREIKFRGKYQENKEWVYGYLYIDESGMYIKPGENNKRFGCGYPVIPSSVGQYTGLKDKNGTEIYEGDIIQHGYVAYQYLIEYITSGFQCCKRPGEICFSLFEADMHRVIGNIHDNPELLTAE